MTNMNDTTNTKKVLQEALIPLPGNAAIYARPNTSTKQQTTQQQSNDLLVLALEYGYKVEEVTIFEDRNVSSKAALVRREAMSKLLHDITDPPPETQPIKAIFVSSEDKLFRDADAVEINTFIETCKAHNVIVVTPTSVYDFVNPSHVALLRFKCEVAGQFHEAASQYITKRLQAGKRHAALRRQRENQQQ